MYEGSLGRGRGREVSFITKSLTVRYPCTKEITVYTDRDRSHHRNYVL